MEKPAIRHILLIDDDQLTNMIIEKMITEFYNFKVTAFTNANEALDKFKVGQYNSPEYLPDVIFLDINMPLMTGWEFLEEFERLPQLIRIKCSVIMLTSSTHTNDNKRANMYSSVAEFVSKPLTIEKLKLLLDGYLMTSRPQILTQDPRLLP